MIKSVINWYFDYCESMGKPPSAQGAGRRFFCFFMKEFLFFIHFAVILSAAKDFLRFGELVFADSAERADPILREILKSCSGGDSVVRIADCGIILVPANIACVLLHD